MYLGAPMMYLKELYAQADPRVYSSNDPSTFMRYRAMLIKVATGAIPKRWTI